VQSPTVVIALLTTRASAPVTSPKSLYVDRCTPNTIGTGMGWKVDLTPPRMGMHTRDLIP
jgi:hypothetical protein